MSAAGYALLFLCSALTTAAAVAAYVAVRTEERVSATASDLISALRRLKAVQEQVQAFDERLGRVAGRVYAQSRKPKPIDDEQLPLDELDPELAAELALQTAPPAAPGKGRAQ